MVNVGVPVHVTPERLRERQPAPAALRACRAIRRYATQRSSRSAQWLSALLPYARQLHLWAVYLCAARRRNWCEWVRHAARVVAQRRGPPCLGYRRGMAAANGVACDQASEQVLPVSVEQPPGLRFAIVRGSRHAWLRIQRRKRALVAR
jgi:hypothetical protein